MASITAPYLSAAKTKLNECGQRRTWHLPASSSALTGDSPLSAGRRRLLLLLLL